jgi:ABC-type uncharacterized transport system permease subunit
MSEFGDLLSLELIRTAIRMTTPILLAALGGLFTLKAGVFNIAMEGMMLTSAFFAVLGGYFLGDPWLGVLSAILAGLVLSLIYALFVVGFRANEFVVGIAINIFATGITVFLLRAIFGVKGSFISPELKGLPQVSFPLLRDIPVLGALLDNHSAFIYLGWALVALSSLLLYRTPVGLWIRAAGEHPEALETAGKSVNWVRTFAILLCGVFCGVAGAHLSLGYLRGFTEAMTDGRGWIALAAVVFGQGDPLATFGAAFLFGFFDGMSLRLQSIGVPGRFSSMIPYFTTILALVVVARRQILRSRRARESAPEPQTMSEQQRNVT